MQKPDYWNRQEFMKIKSIDFKYKAFLSGDIWNVNAKKKVPSLF